MNLSRESLSFLIRIEKCEILWEYFQILGEKRPIKMNLSRESLSFLIRIEKCEILWEYFQILGEKRPILLTHVYDNLHI
jgi:hypothetical protein